MGEAEVAEVEVETPKKDKKSKKKQAEADAAAEEEEVETKVSKKEKKQKRKEAEAEEAPAEEDVEAEVPKKEKKKKKQAEMEVQEEEVELPKKDKKSKKKAIEAEADAAEEKEEAEESAPKKEAQPADVSTSESLTVFIGGIPFSATEDVLRKDFSECGEIEKMNVPMNDEGKPRGIAFITFKSKAGVEAALKFDGDEYGGRTLKVNIAGQKGDKGKGKGKDKGKDKGKGKGNSEFEVFVGGLPFETEEATLKKDFTECGEIESFRMPLNEEGKARGIAFITYKNKEAVDKALAFDGTDYGGRFLKVNKAGEGGKGKDGKGKDGKGKGKDGKGKKGKDGKGKSKGKSKTPEFEGKKQTFDDSDD